MISNIDKTDGPRTDGALSPRAIPGLFHYLRAIKAQGVTTGREASGSRWRFDVLLLLP